MISDKSTDRNSPKLNYNPKQSPWSSMEYRFLPRSTHSTFCEGAYWRQVGRQKQSAVEKKMTKWSTCLSCCLHTPKNRLPSGTSHVQKLVMKESSTPTFSPLPPYYLEIKGEEMVKNIRVEMSHSDSCTPLKLILLFVPFIHSQEF